jgi:hypothetical protein
VAGAIDQQIQALYGLVPIEAMSETEDGRGAADG